MHPYLKAACAPVSVRLVLAVFVQAAKQRAVTTGAKKSKSAKQPSQPPSNPPSSSATSTASLNSLSETADSRQPTAPPDAAPAPPEKAAAAAAAEFSLGAGTNEETIARENEVSTFSLTARAALGVPFL